MENKEAIEMLERFQNPEPWEPQITSRAYEALEMAIAALKKQEQEKWVPVTERLPEEDCLCRITVNTGYNKYIVDCYWNKGKNNFENWSDYIDDFVSITDVTAWKPIEKPYMEDEDNE